MAASTRILSLDLGSHTVGLANFETEATGGLVLVSYAMREILADASHEEARNAQIGAAIAEMLHELHVKTHAVNYCVAAQSVFSRFVKIPSVEEEKIERIIAFEAQQNVPFPIDDVVWDYQLVAAGEDEQIQVVLVAIKSDLLEDVNTAVEGAGLRTQIVDVATTALYNAFRYNYSDVAECSVLVDLGARTTNLLFIEPGKVFSRSVPIGGASMSAAIAKEFGEPPAAAELRKKRDGVVSLGGAYAQVGDPDIFRVSKIIRSTMTKLHAELMRSISYYRSQQQGSAPARVYLCGGTASMPYMREFFQEKLRLPTEFFNPLRNVAVSGAVKTEEISRSAHLLGELVGLALRSVTTCPMELNLRPASVVRAHEITRRRPFLLLAAACFVLGLLGWGIYYTRAANIMRQSADRLSEKVSGLRHVAGQMDAVRKQTAALDEIAKPLTAAMNDRSFWPEIIQDLNERIPKADIWITELVALSGGNPVGGGEMRGDMPGNRSTPPPLPSPSTTRRSAASSEPAIDGIYVRGLYLFNPKQQEVVVDFFRNLVDSPYFAIDPNNQSKVLKPTTPNNTEWAFPYELRLDLKKPVKLP